MDAAERDREFVAGLAAKRPRLHEPQVMRVGGLAAADQARLLGDIAKVVPVAIAPRCRNGEHALVDAVGLIRIGTTARADLLTTGDGIFGRIVAVGELIGRRARDSRCSNASSTSFASVVVSRFLAASAPGPSSSRSPAIAGSRSRPEAGRAGRPIRQGQERGALAALLLAALGRAHCRAAETAIVTPSIAPTPRLRSCCVAAAGGAGAQDRVHRDHPRRQCPPA